MEKAKKKWYQKWWVWVLIVLVIAIIGSNMNSSDDTTTTAQTSAQNDSSDKSTDGDKKEQGKEPEKKEVEKKEENRTITEPGQTIETKNFKFTVESLEKVKSDNQFLQPEEGKEFIAVSVLIENISEKDYSVSSIMMFNAYQDGFSINEDLSAHAAKGGTTTLNGDLAAGKKIRGNLMYQVPTDWKELEIDVDLTALSLFSSDGEIKIKLQNK